MPLVQQAESTLERKVTQWGVNKKKNSNVLPTHQDFNSVAINGQSTEELLTDDKQKKFSYFQMFRYSTLLERLSMLFAIICASLSAIGVPYGVTIYGEFTALLIDRTVAVGSSSPTMILPLFGGGKRLINASKEVNMAALREDATAFGVGCVVGALFQLITIAIAVHILNYVALKQIARIRKEFLESILRQDISWYDTSGGSSFASKMTEDLDKFKEGIAEKVVIFVYLTMTFVMGIIASFIYGWKLTLVVLVCCPFILLSTAMVARIQSSLSEKELKAYSTAGIVAEEVFSSIRTVFAFSGERKEMDRFSERLIPADITGRKKGLYSGIGSGGMWFIIYCAYALAIWYGTQLILEERDLADRNYTPAVLVVVLFGIIMGAQNLGFSTPHLEAFTTANAAAQNIFSIIDRKSQIDSMDERGEKPHNVVGDITFENIHFRYPSRSDVKILQGFSLKIKAGQTVAFVGPSGCGKSTSMQLMQRFYDPLVGSVKLDGRDLRDLNVGWLRSQIGVVGQEPILFATTIEENIRYGNPAATNKDIERCCRTANCHDFIMKLPRGYQTMVGERGAQMSGGQKQRIAIARALLRDPKILLLDEATSALDPTSERRVQDALEIASKGRTTLVVSHRLSTVTNADKIVFVKNGVLAEEGTHEELMAKQGLYYELVNISKRKENTLQDNVPKTIATKEESNKSSDDEISEDDDNGIENDMAKQKRKSTKKVKKEKYKVTTRQLWNLNAPEWRYNLIGCIAAVLHGATYPLWSVKFGEFYGVLSSSDRDYVMSEAIAFAIFFIGIGVLAGLGSLFQVYMFNTAGVKMTSRLRKKAFNTIVSQDVAFFDDEKNSVGALCSRLAGDCSNVQGATGSRVGIIVESISTLLIGTIVAFVFSWEMALVTLVTVPFVCFSIVFEARFTEKAVTAEKVGVERASQVAVEAISNIRTVASLGQERNILERYDEQLSAVDRACKSKIKYRGVMFGLGQVAPLISYGVSIYYGGIMVADGKISYENVIKVSESLIFASWMLGQTMAYAPNMSGALISAGRLIKLFERVPKTNSPQNKPFNTSEKLEGDIVYENVDFTYPNRKDIPILQNFNLRVKSGDTVALVGPSGSGKSTCVQLLLRYYDPVNGAVKLSDIPTTEFSLDTLRSKMGLVSQEPTLFDRTIAENIAYGNNFRNDITTAEIIEVAKKANIHDFIVSLPQGYDTRLGSKGAQLSGGQKQRVAIARALVRNPKILILDEATSALDMESEKVVQRALDTARSGRTCVVIAHRLTTVRDADVICVLKRGVIVEHGTHDELMAKNGIYTELYNLQQVA